MYKAIRTIKSKKFILKLKDILNNQTMGLLCIRVLMARLIQSTATALINKKMNIKNIQTMIKISDSDWHLQTQTVRKSIQIYFFL